MTKSVLNVENKRTVNSLNELSASYEEMAKALNGTVSELENTKYLWEKPSCYVSSLRGYYRIPRRIDVRK